MLRRVADTIERYAMTTPGERIGVAVSGGADSVALLGCLADLAPTLGIELAVLHVNHLLRGAESDADEQFVADLAKRLNLSYFSHRVDVAAEARRAGENLEQTARRARYQWFTALILGGRSAKIATGHTRSDQAETVLFRLLRGAGSAGLAGVRPVVEPGIIRPLLEVSRDEVVAYLRRRGWAWREDSTNEQTTFARNRIRHELLPSLCQDWNPRLPDTLANMAEWARAEEEYWSVVVGDLAGRHLRDEGDAIELDAGAVAQMPEAVQRRLLRAAIERARGDLTSVDFGHVEALRGLATASHGGGKLDLPGIEARRSFGRLRLARPAAQSDARQVSDAIWLQPPGTFAIPGSNCRVKLSLRDCDQTISGRADNEEGYNEGRQKALDWERLPKPLRLRIWQPGDRYQPWGRKGQKKLKSLFQEGKIAAWDRARWPVITAAVPAPQTDSSHGVPSDVEVQEAGAEEKAQRRAARGPEAQVAAAHEVVVWAHQFGPAKQFAADSDSRTVLEISAFWADTDKNVEIFS